MLLAACLALSPRVPVLPAQLVLAAGAVVLELLAVPIGAFGFFSASVACVLAAGPAPGAIAAVLAVAARTLRRGGVPAAAADLAALQAGLLVAAVLTRLGAVVVHAVLASGADAVHPIGRDSAAVASAAAATPLIAIALGAATWALVVTLTYPVLARGLPRPELLPWLRIHRLVLPLRLLAAAASLPLLALSPFLAPFLVAALWGLHRAAESAPLRVAADDLEQERQRVERSAASVEDAWDAAEQAEHRMERALVARGTVEEFARHLASSPGVASTLDYLVEEAGRAVEARSIVAFLESDGSLLPARWASPLARELEAAALLDAREPLVDEAWRTRLTLRSSPDMRVGRRLFPGEEAAVALPMQDEGVLYVGRLGSKRFSDAEMERLAMVAAHAGLALQSVRRHEAEQEALRLHAEANRALEDWVARLGGLLEASEALAATLDPTAVALTLERQARACVPHDCGMLLAADGRVDRAWGDWPAGRSDDAARLVAGTVIRNARPLLIGNLAETRITAPAPGLVSLLAAPLVAQEGAVGALLVGARATDAFGREQQDVLYLLACQAAIALSNAGLFRALQESQAQLVQSSKMAAVGQLAAGVAHEINSPLGAILLAVEAAAEKIESNPEAARKRLDRARKAADRARRIIEKLLQFARGGDEERRPVDVNDVADEAADFLGHQLELEGFALTRERADVPPVSASPTELQQVITNLVLNARDASQEAADKTIRLFTACADGEVIIGVEDHGEGIPDDVLPRIFEPFFTAKPVGKGTGLGLSVTHQIIESHGGRIEIASRVGEGTTFTVRLPAIASQLPISPASS